MITFLFTDMEGSTRFWEASPEGMRAAMERHDALLTEGIERHGGRVILERGEGDSFFGVFDEPADAIAGAGWIQYALATERWPDEIPVRVRMAIHTGEADDHLRGTDVNRCARLRAIAHGGQVLVSATARDAAMRDDTARSSITLVDLGLHRLRDLTQPERVFQLRQPDLPAEFPPLRSMEAFRHNLPVQLTTFIGRERELAQLGDLIRQRNLVTLVGSGGCGKTRLALQTAGDLLEEFEDGCWFVDLAPIAKTVTVKARAFKEGMLPSEIAEANFLLMDSGAVPRVLAETLAVREEPGRPLVTTLAEQLADKRLLLILDNCEHVIQAAAEVAEALTRRAPRLRVVATSREQLTIPGELAWPVPSLALPNLDRLPSAEEILDFEAVRLFCDRAATARPGFAPGAGDGPAIARICARLDGIPLAIELAAARVRVLPPKEILARLEDRFRLLTGGSRVLSRHQTLRAAVEWSYQLLAEPERVLFRRLAVFAGSFDLDAAERIGAGEPVDEADVLDLLSQLVNKSLLMADEGAEGTIRYRLLETLRQYAAERLDESGEAGATRSRHLAHFRELAEQAFAERIEAEATWLSRLDRDHDDLRGALAWALEHRPVEALRLAGALGWFWHLHGHLSEGRTHLAAALTGPREPGPELARALWSAGTLAAWQGDVEAARPLLEESRQMYEALGDRIGVALCLDSLGWALIIAGDAHTALRNWEEGLRIQLELGNARLIELARVAVCQGLVAVKDVERAEPMAAEILTIALESRDDRNAHFGYHFLADCALMRADAVAAQRLYGKSLRAALTYGDGVEVAFEVEGVAMSIAGLDQAVPALRLGGAVEARRKELGLYLSIAFWNEFEERWFGLAREALSPVAADAAWADGRAMGWEAAVREALGQKG